MSSEAIPSPTEQLPTTKSAKSYLARVVDETISRGGARFGLFWIGAIGLCALLASFLASSHPYLMKANGGWSSPLLRHLSPADVALPVLVVLTGLFLKLKWLGPAARWITFCFVGAAVIFGCVWLIKPPRAIVYDQYRQKQRSGQIQWALFAPIPYSPSDRLRDQPTLIHPMPPNRAHWMGTDRHGSDMVSKMIHACRIAMAVGFIATGIALVIGVSVGAVMGYFAGLVDLIGMRVVEVVAAIPTFFLLLSFVAFFPRNLYVMMVIIGITGWVGYARFTRAEFLKLRQQDFVLAARACGLPLTSILARHMLPNGVAPVMVEASFGVAAAILYESTLSFLGLGLIEQPSWGQLLQQASSSGASFYWWLASFPGLAIFFTVFGYNLVGEALRDAIDPHRPTVVSSR